MFALAKHLLHPKYQSMYWIKLFLHNIYSLNFSSLFCFIKTEELPKVNRSLIRGEQGIQLVTYKKRHCLIRSLLNKSLFFETKLNKQHFCRRTWWQYILYQKRKLMPCLHLGHHGGRGQTDAFCFAQLV